MKNGDDFSGSKLINKKTASSKLFF